MKFSKLFLHPIWLLVIFCMLAYYPFFLQGKVVARVLRVNRFLLNVRKPEDQKREAGEHDRKNT